MKIRMTKRHMIVLGIAFILIGLGLVQAITGWEINRKVMDQLSFVLLLAAAFVLFSGRRKRTEEAAKDQQEVEQAAQDNAQKQDENEKLPNE